MYLATKAQRGSRLYPVWTSTPRPGRFTPVPIVREAGGSQGRSARKRRTDSLLSLNHALPLAAANRSSTALCNALLPLLTRMLPVHLQLTWVLAWVAILNWLLNSVLRLGRYQRQVHYPGLVQWWAVTFYIFGWVTGTWQQAVSLLNWSKGRSVELGIL